MTMLHDISLQNDDMSNVRVQLCCCTDYSFFFLLGTDAGGRPAAQTSYLTDLQMRGTG